MPYVQSLLHHLSRLLKSAQQTVGVRKIVQGVACAIVTRPQTTAVGLESIFFSCRTCVWMISR
jgi:hypothetical protein